MFREYIEKSQTYDFRVFNVNARSAISRQTSIFKLKTTNQELTLQQTAD